MAACQDVTREWWEQRRRGFDLYVSEFVIIEASLGDQGAAAKRLEMLEGIPELNVTDDARRLAGRLLSEGHFRQKPSSMPLT